MDSNTVMEVRIPVLEKDSPHGAACFNHSRTLRITPTGKCETVPDDEPGTSLERKSDIESPMANYSIKRLRISIKHHFVQSLVRIEGDQSKEKRINASPDVLASYHNAFLYGEVPLTIKIRSAIRSGPLHRILVLLEFLAAVISIVAYLRSTYVQTSHWALTARRIVAFFFVTDYLLKLYSAPVRFYYFISVTGLVDLLSTSSILSMWGQFRNDGAIPQMLLVLRALRILPTITIFGDTIAQQIFLLTMHTLGAVFIAAGILQWVEFKATSTATKIEEGCDPDGCFTFYDAFYFVVVTITTVGYGDFTPKSNLGRLVTLSIMLIAALILPAQINKILQLASRRPYGGKLTLQKAVASNFIIISGTLSLKTIRHFLAGFYHPNHSKEMEAFPIRVVIMAPFKPSYAMKTLLNHYGGHVQFIEGTPNKEADLDRVYASFATAVFLFADELAQDYDTLDTTQITRTLSIHRHCGPKVRVLVELKKPENKNNAIWNETKGVVDIICPELVRFQLLARSCYIQGFSTFVINLFRSGLILSHPNPLHWMSEYYDGLRQEIFPVILPSCFHREKLKFEEAAEVVYEHTAVILVGLDVKLPNETREVRLYPRGRFITSTDIGLVIARDLQTAESVSKYNEARSRKQKWFHQQQDMEMGELKQCHGNSSLCDEVVEKESGASGGALEEEAKEDVDQKMKFVSFLEEAIEAVTRWPPLETKFKPDGQVFEKRVDIILENLRLNTINVVLLPRPHVLLCVEGKWPLNLFYFVKNLRVSTESHVSLVILHPNTPSAADWGSVALFPDVHFVKGSALCELDLVRAGVFQAMKVVVLTEGLQGDLDEADTTSLDVKNIVITANVERLVHPESNRVIVELQQDNQFQFLIRSHLENDTMQFNHRGFQRDRDARLQFAPAYASGKGLCPATFTFLTYATFFNRNTGSVIEQLCCGRRAAVDEEDGDDNSVRKLEQIRVPEHYIGLCFREVFQGLLRNEKMLALGIYRPAGTHGSLVSYVSTNPAPPTQLTCGDLVYVFH